MKNTLFILVTLYPSCCYLKDKHETHSYLLIKKTNHTRLWFCQLFFVLHDKNFKSIWLHNLVKGLCRFLYVLVFFNWFKRRMKQPCSFFIQSQPGTLFWQIKLARIEDRSSILPPTQTRCLFSLSNTALSFLPAIHAWRFFF